MLAVEFVKGTFSARSRSRLGSRRFRMLGFASGVHEFPLHYVKLRITVWLVVLEHQVGDRHELAGRGDHGHVVFLPFAKPAEEGSDRTWMIGRCLDCLH